MKTISTILILFLFYLSLLSQVKQREFVEALNEATSISTNKEEKLNLVYDYLTGNDFEMHIMDVSNNLKGMMKQLNRVQT